MTVASARRLLNHNPELVSEAEWATVVNDLARIGGFRRYHTYRSEKSPAGFPDLVLCKPPRLIFAELKGPKTRVTQEQTGWLDDLSDIPGVEVFLWRPADYDEVVRVLTGRSPRA